MNFMFEFPCIISLYYIKNQQDATLAVLFTNNCKILQLLINSTAKVASFKLHSYPGFERVLIRKHSCPLHMKAVTTLKIRLSRIFTFIPIYRTIQIEI